MNRAFAVAAAALGIWLGIAALAGPAGAGDSSAAAKKVVIQVSEDDPAKWNLAINNAENVRELLGPEAEIEVVAYGRCS